MMFGVLNADADGTYAWRNRFDLGRETRIGAGQSKNLLETCMPPCNTKVVTEAEIDLPLSLLRRLVESRIVPTEAKIRSIESWQRELAGYPSNNPRMLDLINRLELAKSAVLGQRRHRSHERFFRLTTRVRRWWSTNHTDHSSVPHYAHHAHRHNSPRPPSYLGSTP
jgi:hypothetical protein